MKLFIYGTLLSPSIQNMVFGRDMEGVDVLLPGFEKNGLNIVESDAGEVSGKIIELNLIDKENVDHYEGPGYKLIEVGKEIFAYQLK